MPLGSPNIAPKITAFLPLDCRCQASLLDIEACLAELSTGNVIMIGGFVKLVLPLARSQNENKNSAIGTWDE